MVISPNDFSLWSRLTGNKYPSTPRERAQKGPEVQRFIQNLGREGMLEGKQEEEQKKKKSLPEKLATGALIAGGVAAGVAAARDKRVQDVAQRVGSTVRDRTQEFLKNLGPGQEVDVDIVDASGDVTPDPVQQQSNTGPEITVNVSDKYTPIVQGKTYKTEGAISREDPYGDIGNVSKRVDRAYGGLLEGFKNIPGVDVDQRRRQLTRETEKGRDFDIAYMVARGQGRDDTAATQIARAAAGLDTSPAVRPPTEYRKFLGEQKTGSIIKAKIDDLINMVQPGQIARVEGVDQSNLDKYGTWQNNVQVSTNNATPDNKMLKPGAEIGGTTLVDQHATKMAVDNTLDNARDAYEKQISTIIDAGKTGGGSIKSRAGAEAFLQKYRTNVVRNLDEAIQKDLQATTGLSAEDAANIALSVIDPITGQRQVDPGSVQKVGSKFVSKKVSRNPLGEKSVPNIDPDTNQGTMKTAVGTAIRGRAPSYYEAGFQTKERQDPLLLPGDEDTMISDRPSKERAQFVPTPFDKEQQSKEGGSAGIGIYGEGTGYLAGPFSKTASKAPTDVFGKSSPFKGVSDSTLTKLKSDMKPGTKSFESVDKEQKGRASMDAARELRKIQTSGDPNTATERVGKFLDNLKKLQGG